LVSDQAHFANDFKALVGCPPASYAASCLVAGELVGS
jgi:AraC-like DNA-binding protein